METSSLKTRLLALLLALSAVFTFTVYGSLREIHEAAESLEDLYENRVLPQDHLRKISEAYGIVIPSVLRKYQLGEMTASEAAHTVVEQSQYAEDRWDTYRRTTLLREEEALIPLVSQQLSRAHGIARQFISTVGEPTARSRVPSYDEMVGAGEALAVTLRDLQTVQRATVVQELANSKEAEHTAGRWLYLAFFVALVLGGSLGWSVYRKHQFDLVLADESHKRVNSFYMALSRMNKLVAKEKSWRGLVEGACRICVETGYATVATYRELQQHDLVMVADAGHNQRLVSFLPKRLSAHVDCAKDSPEARAVTQGTPQLCKQDSLPSLEPVWGFNPSEGGVSLAGAVPVLTDAQKHGVLSLYSDEPNAFDEETLAVLAEMGADLAHALSSAELEAQSIHAQCKARDIQDLFERLFQMSPIAIFVVDAVSFEVLNANESACLKYGVTRDFLVGSTLEALGMGLLSEYREQFRAELARTGAVRDMEVLSTTRSGEQRQSLIYGQPVDFLGRRALLISSVDVTERHQKKTSSMNTPQPQP